MVRFLEHFLWVALHPLSIFSPLRCHSTIHIRYMKEWQSQWRKKGSKSGPFIFAIASFACMLKKIFLQSRKTELYFNQALFWGFLSCEILFVPLGYSREIKTILNEIPVEDKQMLESLFYRLMNDDHLSYTLFGDKPVSSSGDFIITPLNNLLNGMDCGGIFWKNWGIWKKYKKIFPLTHYLFIEGPSKENMKAIFLINKSAFRNKVNQHIQLFQKTLGNKSITADILLKTIEDKNDLLYAIHENQMLYGILLGYGVHNSQLFSKREKLRPFIQPKQNMPLLIPKLSPQFSSITDEFNSYFSILLPFGDYSYSPLIMQPVHFVADPKHPETTALQKKYADLQSKISTIYAKGNFLEITLSQLTSE